MGARLPSRRVLLHTSSNFLRWLRAEDHLLVVLEAARWDGPDGSPIDWRTITTAPLPISSPSV